MRTIAYLLIHPLSWLILLVVLFLVFRYLGKRKLAAGATVLAGIWVLTVLFSPIPFLLTELLENEYPVAQPQKINLYGEHIDVLVLGAGYTPDKRLPATQQISRSKLTRLVEAVRIYRLLPEARLITSGGYSKNSTQSQGKAASLAAVQLGVSPADTAYLEKTETTFHEAVTYKKRFGTSNTVFLVTDATHMKRAAYLFEKQGIKVIPAPADFKVKIDPNDPERSWLPSYKKVRLLRGFCKEKLGFWYARATSE